MWAGILSSLVLWRNELTFESHISCARHNYLGTTVVHNNYYMWAVTKYFDLELLNVCFTGWNDTLTAMAVLVYLLPDSRSKPDHAKVLYFSEV